MSRISGFTLIEILMVLAIIMVVMGMMLAVPTSDRKDAAVGQVARELAQTMRQARAMAIEHQAPVAITFNIQNASGTSGKTLNNWTGGHWYQIVGSFEQVSGAKCNDLAGLHGLPSGSIARRLNTHLALPGDTLDTPADTAVDRIRSCYIGDRRVLPARKVRFLALTDQDNGGYRPDSPDKDPWNSPDNRNMRWNGSLPRPNRYAAWWGASYPRPWFGVWDAASKRLMAWGGYDHTLIQQHIGANTERMPGGQPISPSGFFYEGNDGAITGSVHPRDRWIVADRWGNDGLWSRADDSFGHIPRDDNPVTAFTTRFFTAGQPRALINGDWMDSTLEFWPDGRVRSGIFLGMRKAYAATTDSFKWLPSVRAPGTPTGAAPSGGYPWDLSHLGPGDMCNHGSRTGDTAPTGALWWLTLETSASGAVSKVGAFAESNGRSAADAGSWAAEASNYTERTGWTWITLGPDAERDDDVHSSVQSAMLSLLPAYRVGVSPYGDVRIVRVARGIPADTDADFVLDEELAGAKWEDTSFMPQRYHRNLRTGSTREDIGAVPAQDFITTDMLEKRTWWMLPR